MPSSHDNASSFLVRVASVAALAALAVTAHAGPREQAKRIHDRIAGVPPSSAVLDAMEAEITGGDTLAAAMIAMDNPSFYSVTLKNLVTPWTNRAQSVFEPLNDYTATVIGMVRDDLPFNTVLSADVLYVGAAGLGLPGELFGEGVRLILGVFKAWWESDASLLEINPLAVVESVDGAPALLALDAKVSLDDNALHRHKDLLELRDLNEEAPLEIEASRFMRYLRRVSTR